MPKDSKGKRVKQFKEMVPQPDLTSREEVQHVYFKAADGMFIIYLPSHIAKLIGDALKPDDHDSFRIWQNSREPTDVELRSTTLDGALAGWKRASDKYRDILKHENKKKVISFTLKYNVGFMENGVPQFRRQEDISFCGRPALHLDYEVQWQIGDAIYYYAKDDQTNLTRRGSAHGNLIDWTQEREDFFASMKGALTNIIHKLIAFQEALTKDPDAAMLAFSNARAMLPPPPPHRDDPKCPKCGGELFDESAPRGGSSTVCTNPKCDYEAFST